MWRYHQDLFQYNIIQGITSNFIRLACGCHPIGSIKCDEVGKCKCKVAYEGSKCNECKFGYYKFPRCENFPENLNLFISGKAKSHQGSRVGTYHLQSDTTNEKPYWIQTSKEYAIWWTPNDSWMVGDFSDLGTKRGGIKGPIKNDGPPNQIEMWKFTDGRYWINTKNIDFNAFNITHKTGKNQSFIR